MFTLSSTRFNNDTWNENESFRKKNGLQGCIYCSPLSMSHKIPLDSHVFIVEMNNTKNEIEGIGLVKNNPITNKPGIYTDLHFSRYIFIGKYRLNRDVILRHHPALIEALDYVLFKEKTHLKRGSGMTTIPEKLLNHPKCNGINIKKEINELFILYFTNTNNFTKI